MFYSSFSFKGKSRHSSIQCSLFSHVPVWSVSCCSSVPNISIVSHAFILQIFNYMLDSQMWLILLDGLEGKCWSWGYSPVGKVFVT